MAPAGSPSPFCLSPRSPLSPFLPPAKMEKRCVLQQSFCPSHPSPPFPLCLCLFPVSQAGGKSLIALVTGCYFSGTSIWLLVVFLGGSRGRGWFCRRLQIKELFIMPGHGWRVSREGGDLMIKVIVSVFQCLYSLVEAGLRGSTN